MNPQVLEFDKITGGFQKASIFSDSESMKLLSAIKNAIDETNTVTEEERKEFNTKLEELIQVTAKGRLEEQDLVDLSNAVVKSTGVNQNISQALEYLKVRSEFDTAGLIRASQSGAAIKSGDIELATALETGDLTDLSATQVRLLEDSSKSDAVMISVLENINKTLLDQKNSQFGQVIEEIKAGDRSIDSGLTEIRAQLSSGNEQEKEQLSALNRNIKLITESDTDSIAEKIKEKNNQAVLRDGFEILSDKLDDMKDNTSIIQQLKEASTAEQLGGSVIDQLLGDGDGKGGKGKGGKSGLMGKVGGMFSKASIGGIVGGVALDYASDKAKDAGHQKTGAALSVGSSAASGAGMGAAIGSVVPGIGTAIGAGVGAVIGAGVGIYQNAGAFKKSPSENEKAMSAELDAQGITGKSKAILMGQLSHESGGFKYLTELGGPSYFKKYDGRKDLGNTQPGDGERFKGRGFIQITGRDNYVKAGNALGIDLVNNPELAARPDIAAKVAMWYLNTRKRKGKSVVQMATEGDIEGVTRAINGGLNGYADRIAKTEKYMKDMPGDTQMASLSESKSPAQAEAANLQSQGAPASLIAMATGVTPASSPAASKSSGPVAMTPSNVPTTSPKMASESKSPKTEMVAQAPNITTHTTQVIMSSGYDLQLAKYNS